MIIRRYEPEIIAEASSIVKNNGIIIIPTIRWYMICCRADDANSINRIFAGKQRPLSKIPLFIPPDKADICQYFSYNSAVEKIANSLWPGEISLYLKWLNSDISSIYDAKEPHALVCCPSGIFGQIAAHLGMPLAATTANVCGTNDKGPAITAKQALDFVSESQVPVELIIDDGICPCFTHTTILDCTDEKISQPKMIREGFVHCRAIEQALQDHN